MIFENVHILFLTFRGSSLNWKAIFFHGLCYPRFMINFTRGQVTTHLGSTLCGFFVRPFFRSQVAVKFLFFTFFFVNGLGDREFLVCHHQHCRASQTRLSWLVIWYGSHLMHRISPMTVHNMCIYIHTYIYMY